MNDRAACNQVRLMYGQRMKCCQHLELWFIISAACNHEITVLNIFPSVFNGNLSSHTSWVGQQDGGWGSKVLPTVREDQVHDYLRNLNLFKSIGPGEMHPRILRALSDTVPKPLSMISWQLNEASGD